MRQGMRAFIWVVVAFIVLAAIVSTLFGCTTSPEYVEAGNPQAYPRVAISKSVSRFIDTEYGNVCYVYWNTSIDCLPLTD